jgi:hypothetical protein
MASISTCVKTLGYYVPTLPDHIEETFGSYFESVAKNEQYVLLATLSSYVANLEVSDWDNCTLFDIYCQHAPGVIGQEIIDLFPDLEQLEQQSPGTLAALIQPLILNILYTSVEE